MLKRIRAWARREWREWNGKRPTAPLVRTEKTLETARQALGINGRYVTYIHPDAVNDAYEPPYVPPAVLPYWLCMVVETVSDGGMPTKSAAARQCRGGIVRTSMTWALWDPADGPESRAEKSAALFTKYAKFRLEAWNGTVAYEDLVHARHYVASYDFEALLDGWTETAGLVLGEGKAAREARIAVCCRAAHWAETGIMAKNNAKNDAKNEAGNV